jgi:hypothetical protein
MQRKMQGLVVFCACAFHPIAQEQRSHSATPTTPQRYSANLFAGSQHRRAMATEFDLASDVVTEFLS